MPNFKGFDDWIEIFRGGIQTDGVGVEHNGDVVIEKALALFNPKYHEPPIVLGHPKDNAPAYGWVSDLKKGVADDGENALYAKCKQVVPEFAQAVKDGLWKKRSSSFYPDGRLRHIGFLGAVPPAVKGIKDMAFSENDQAITFDFSDTKQSTSMWESMFKGMRDFFEKNEGVKNINNKIQEGGNMPTFSEEQVQEKLDQQKKELMEEAAKVATEVISTTRKKVEAEFAEKNREEATKQRLAEIATFCETQKKDGKLIPAWEKAGIKEFMEALDAETVIEFGEKKDKLNTYAWFKNFLEELPKVINFEEIATRGDDVGDDSNEGKREKLIADFCEKNQNVSYKDAVIAVSAKHPKLFTDE